MMKFVGLFVIVVIAMMFLDGASSKPPKNNSKSSKKNSSSSESWESCDLCSSFEDGFNDTAAILSEILESTRECAAGNSATCPPTTTCPSRGAAVVYVTGDVGSADKRAAATCPDGYIVVGCTSTSNGVYLGANVGPGTDPKNCNILFLDPGNYQAVATCVLKDDDESITYKKYTGAVGGASEISCPAGEELIQCFVRTEDFYADPIVDKANNKCSCPTAPMCRTTRAICKATAP